MYAIEIRFRQKAGAANRSLCKVVQLAAIPSVGSLFEYQEGWALEAVQSSDEKGLHLVITGSSVIIEGYGPQFDEQEAADLLQAGWSWS